MLVGTARKMSVKQNVYLIRNGKEAKVEKK